jgi:glutamine synthetase
MYYKNEEKSKRIEFRCPDPCANPYLAFSAMLIYGISGIQKKLDPKKLGFGPYEKNIWEKKDLAQTPKDLFETLEALKKDKILLESQVFAKEILESYYDLKWNEATESLMYPTPADFYFYADI